MSDSHTWSENCVLCGGTCHLGKGKPKKQDEAPTTKPEGAKTSKASKKGKTK